jgi:hypothetical protein
VARCFTSRDAYQAVSFTWRITLSTEAFEIAQAFILALGGGALIVFGLSSFLGKLWAQRILQNEKSEHEKLIAQFKHQLDSLAHKKSLNYQQKIDLYKIISTPLVELIALITHNKGLTAEHVHEFDKQRLHITAQLVLFAPQKVFDAFSNMVDYIYDSIEKNNFDFIVFRNMALMYMSEMRKDIGIYHDEIKYNGNR